MPSRATGPGFVGMRMRVLRARSLGLLEKVCKVQRQGCVLRSRELDFKLPGENGGEAEKLGAVNGGASGTTSCGPEER
jgi:hypothetical protein